MTEQTDTNRVLSPAAMTERPAQPVIYSVPQVAKILRIGRNATYELVKTGKIRCIRIGKTIRIPQAALEEFLTNNLS